jgi:hypothetical protein
MLIDRPVARGRSVVCARGNNSIRTTQVGYTTRKKRERKSEEYKQMEESEATSSQKKNSKERRNGEGRNGKEPYLGSSS